MRVRRSKRERIEQRAAEVKARLEQYYRKEEELLTEGKVKSYQIGTRELEHYEFSLKQIQDIIKTLEDELDELTGILEGDKPRRAVSVIPRDW